MTTFQQSALVLIAIWLALIAVWFRRSVIVLIGGLVALGAYALAALFYGKVTPAELGLAAPDSWLRTIGFAIVWLGLMLAYSPLADWLATRCVAEPPTLDKFRALQQSTAKLIAGIVVAWLLGGFLEELVFRGIVLQSAETWATTRVVGSFAAAFAICIAAIGTGVIHLYQGPRAVAMITQLSVLFSVLFLMSGHNLWAVMFCHGMYDTVAFIRFAKKKSKYSHVEHEPR